MLVDFFRLGTPSFRKLRDKAHQHKAPTDLPTQQRKPRQRRSSSFYIVQKPKLVRKEHLELRQKRRKDLGIRDKAPSSTKKNNLKGGSSGKRVHAAEEFDINNPEE